MKRAVTLIRLFKTVLSVFISMVLILTVTVDGNDDVTLVFAATFITLLIAYFILALIEDLLINAIDRQIESLERELEKRNERMFCDVKPCRSGWERRAN